MCFIDEIMLSVAKEKKKKKKQDKKTHQSGFARLSSPQTHLTFIQPVEDIIMPLQVNVMGDRFACE